MGSVPDSLPLGVRVKVSLYIRETTIMSQSHGSQVDCSTLIKAQVSVLDTSTDRGTSEDQAEDTHQRVHHQRIRLEAVYCEYM